MKRYLTPEMKLHLLPSQTIPEFCFRYWSFSGEEDVHCQRVVSVIRKMFMLLHRFFETPSSLPLRGGGMKSSPVRRGNEKNAPLRGRGMKNVP